MTLKTAAFFAFIGMTLLTVMLAALFIRDVSSLLAGAVATISVLAAAHSFAGKSECGGVSVRVL